MKPLTNDLGSQLIRGIHEACAAQQREITMSLAVRWWIRNARTGQLLGSVLARSEDEALGKAIVRFGLSGWEADKYTAHISEGSNAEGQRGARAGDDAEQSSDARDHAARQSRAGGGRRQAVRRK